MGGVFRELCREGLFCFSGGGLCSPATACVAFPQYQLALAQFVVDATPANVASRETRQPDEKCERIPEGDERVVFPKALLLQPIFAYQGRDDHAASEISAKISRRDRSGGMDSQCKQAPGQTPGE